MQNLLNNLRALNSEEKEKEQEKGKAKKSETGKSSWKPQHIRSIGLPLARGLLPYALMQPQRPKGAIEA